MTRPALVIRIPLEGTADIHLSAETREDEERLIAWLRVALRRREPLSLAIAKWLEMTEREVA